MRLCRLLLPLLLLPLLGSCNREPEYDLLVRGGTIYDGTGSAGIRRRRRDQGRSHRLRRPQGAGQGDARDRRDGPGGRARLHQHALLVRTSRCSSTAAARASCARASRSRSWARALHGPAHAADEGLSSSRSRATSSTRSSGRRSASTSSSCEKKGVSMNVASLVGAATAAHARARRRTTWTRRRSSSKAMRASCSRRWRRARSASAPR